MDEKVWTQFVVGPGQDIREEFPIPGGYAYVGGSNGSMACLLRISVEVIRAPETSDSATAVPQNED